MTSIRDRLRDTVGVGETVRVTLEEPDELTSTSTSASADGDMLIATHPRADSPLDIAVVYGLERLEDRPPVEPVEIEIIGEVIDGRIAGRVVEADDR